MIRVGSTRLPPPARVAKAAARCTGETDNPCPKEIVIDERSDHLGGNSGAAPLASVSSRGSGSKNPRRLK